MVDAYVPDPKSALSTRDALRSLLLYLDSRVRREQLETWFRSLDVTRIEDSAIELSVTSQFVRDWLMKNYMTLLQDAVRSLGEEKRRIVLTQRQEDGWDSLRFFQPTPMSEEIDEIFRTSVPFATAAATGPSGYGQPLEGHPGIGHPTTGNPVSGQPTHSQLGHAPVRRRPGTLLNPNYTFDRFVVGSCNRLAHASALAIGENPGHAYNPLFVHGNVGLGKSHLLQAICHTVLKRSPNARVLYMSCEDFANAFIHALQTKTADTFRDYYRHADVLVIDDVQFLAHKEKCQEEFFHTFNALYDSQRQIVLSSDRRPADIPTIEGRIESRFHWGLVAEVEAPCFETRAAIVRRKAKGRGVDLPEEVALLLAERVTSNIRELEGAVIKVIGIAAVTEEPVTLALAESCVRGMPARHAQVTADDVMLLITTEFAINSRELVGKSRTQTVSVPRQIAMFLLREHTELSLDDVGRIFGNRDHTTVLYAVTRVRERILKDRMFKELLDGLGNRLLTRTVRS